MIEVNPKQKIKVNKGKYTVVIDNNRKLVDKEIVASVERLLCLPALTPLCLTGKIGTTTIICHEQAWIFGPTNPTKAAYI